MKHIKTQEEIAQFNQRINHKINNNSQIKAYWNFFTTPQSLIEKMLEEYKSKPLPKNILEPSAGKGDIIDYINRIQNKRKEQSNIYAFEFVPELQKILKSKDAIDSVIDQLQAVKQKLEGFHEINITFELSDSNE